MRGDSAGDGGAELSALIRQHITAAQGWLPFERFMALALYAPGLGYYSRSARQFGSMPSSGSDFVTAPELSPLFGATLARPVAQLLDVAGVDEIVEFGAGSGALAAQLLAALGERVRRYTIIDLSGSLRARQAERLAPWAGRVVWLDTLPAQIEAVVIGNEVLDAMPVQRLHFDGERWFERGVALAAAGTGFVWRDRETELRPPLAADFAPGTTTEVHPQALAFTSTLAERLTRGAALFIDYGFPEAEYWHPERRGGTLVAHRAHRVETDENALLADPGSKDLTAHVDFSGVALAAQDGGLDVLGYTAQGRFLLNCGLADLMQDADIATRANAHKLIAEHEMGELFKVLLLGRGLPGDFVPLGFEAGDRTHTL
jgi:SAM-dependent MidA family methyltransferase